MPTSLVPAVPSLERVLTKIKNEKARGPRPPAPPWPCLHPRPTAGLWNLSLCYERGVGVERDPIVAQALQQQCRDRENKPQHKRSASVVGTGSGSGATVESGKRSSEPSVSVPSPTDGGNIDAPLETGGARQARRSSSPVPFATPPPPAGPPPAHVKRKSNSDNTTADSKSATTLNGDDRGGHKHGSTGVTAPEPSGGYKYVPEGPGDGPVDNVRPSAGGYGVDRRGSGAAGVVGVDREKSEPVGPALRQRSDSLLLKPTPLAIARVKAAVERRKALEAAAVSAAAVKKPP